MFGHTKNKSGGGYVVVCQCVCDTVCLPKNCCLLKNLGALMFKIGKFWCCYQTIFGVEYKLGRQSVLEILYTVEINYWVWTTIEICIQKDNISYRCMVKDWRKCRNYSKKCQRFSEEPVAVFLRHRDAIWSRVSMVMLAV